MIDHVALAVRAFDWYVTFFQDTFEMKVKKTAGEKPNRKLWFHEGIQLIEDFTAEHHKGVYDHIGMITEEPEKVDTKMKEYGCSTSSKGDNWYVLPNGILIEVQKRAG